ncbi:MAG: sigma-70 family RNA polymerase sigma factor [Acidobacteria bacterium]|nr:sigma-70 family RNA polymerase sigma factor [Acidobacteriota bacterium]MCB9398212.1 sigma-70 family RNA polymerase sigma factor [Acidobacteriota bacterium]
MASDASFEDLVQQYHLLVLHLIRRYYGGALGHLEEDLSQEVWTKLWDSFQKNESNIVQFKSYLYRTVQTTLWDAMRRLDQQTTESLADQLEEPQAEPFSPGLISQLDLEKKMDGLNREERLMVQAWLKGFSYQEIADLLACGEGRVRNCLSRIRKKLAGS